MKTASLSVLVAATALACDYRAPLGDNLTVVALAPANGAGVGAPGAAAPAFRWRASPAASAFHLQVDDSCDAPATCAFPSPEVDETQLTATTHVLPAALATSTAAPVGRRYYWRVRACSASEMCGAWSPVRYVVAGRVAGRLNTDLNGDGYPDVAVAAPSSSAVAQQAGQVFVYLGGPTPSSVPALVIASDRERDMLGDTVAMAGDVNGDGFGDLIVRTNGPLSIPGPAPTPRVLLFFGGPTLHAEPDVTLAGCVFEGDNQAAAGIGDVDGDGYDDIAFGGYLCGGDALERVEIHRGGPSLGGPPYLTLIGRAQSLAGAGDVNGDGYPDLIVGADGDVSVHFGGPAMDEVPDVTLSNRSLQSRFGVSVAVAGDVNGDGYDDIVVGAPGDDAYPTDYRGQALVYFGAATISAEPNVAFTTTVPVEAFARTVAPAGDVNGDGYDDIAVITPGVSAAHLPVALTGRRVDLFFGGPVVDTVPDVTLAAGAPSVSRRGFAATDLDGDALPDLVVGHWVESDAQPGRVSVFLGKQSYAMPALTLSATVARDEFGASIGR